MKGESDQPYSRKPRQSPLWLVLILTFSIFVIETLSHTLTDYLLIIPKLGKSLFDSVLLVALLSPILYFFVLRPLNRSLEERERAEEAVSRLAAIVTSSDDAIFSGNLDGIILSWNAGAERIYGYSSGEIQGRPASILVPPDRSHEIPHILETIRRGESVEHYETVRVRKNGKQIHMSITASPIRDDRERIIGISAIGRDITGRKQAEQALRESEARYRGLFEASRDGIVLTDMEGWIRDANPAYCEMVGYELAELRHMTYKELTPPQWRAMEQTIVRDQIMTRGYCDEYEKEYIRKDGRVIPINLRVWLTRDDQGQPAGHWAIVRDITERKRAMEEIQRHSLELEAANKELEAFSYSASHDLRTPLVAIGGLTRILLEEYSSRLDEKGREFLSTICKRTDLMRELIDDLLAFSRSGRQALRESKIDMNELAANVIEELKLAESGRGVQFNMSRLPPIRGDQVMIRQVFVNLLSNAMKFTRPKPEPVIEIGGEEEERGNTYYVKDNGVGFDMAEAAKLFEVFKRLRHPQEFEGTGVGLAIVQRVIQRHGGRVWAEGKNGEGATFYFSLPR